MCKPAARVGDHHVCPKVSPGPTPHVGGGILSGSPNVFFDGLQAARVGDPALCGGVPTQSSINEGSPAVLINGKRAARLGDGTDHSGAIAAGSSGIMIGETGQIRISDEVAGPILVVGKVLVACNCPPEVQQKAAEDARRRGLPFCEVCQKCCC